MRVPAILSRCILARWAFVARRCDCPQGRHRTKKVELVIALAVSDVESEGLVAG